MANIKAAQTGNWSATSTWTGGVVPVSGDNVSSNNFAVTVDVNATVANVTNGTTYGATAGGSFTLNNGVTLTATCTCAYVSSLIYISGTASASIVGNITSFSSTGGVGVYMSSTGTLTIIGNISAGNGASAFGVVNTAGGTINITNAICTGAAGGGVPAAVQNSAGGTIIMTSATVNGSGGVAVNNALSGVISITGNVTAGALAAGATNSSTGTFTIIGDITASNGANGFTSASASATNRLSGSFIASANGTAAIYATKYVLWSTPLLAKTRYAKDGISQYVDFFTADNSLTQANPTDVRTGVSYASGALTGTLTVPEEGSVVLNAPVGPLMPFTATRSSTTATATLAYSYPYTAGDKIVVTGASNTEWNGTYTIASVISGTSITFIVPVTYSSTAGTGAQMQTVGTAVLTAANIFDTLTSTMTTAGSIGERLANTSTVAVTGQQITNALG